MPNKDGTGPEGKGPRTGRSRGHCAGANPESGRGFGEGRGQGRGLGNGRRCRN